jgi:signal transduction histidine kinase
VTKWLVGAHNGRIELESDIGQGYRFTVLLPLANPALYESDVPD